MSEDKYAEIILASAEGRSSDVLAMVGELVQTAVVDLVNKTYGVGVEAPGEEGSGEEA